MQGAGNERTGGSDGLERPQVAVIAHAAAGVDVESGKSCSEVRHRVQRRPGAAPDARQVDHQDLAHPERGCERRGGGRLAAGELGGSGRSAVRRAGRCSAHWEVWRSTSAPRTRIADLRMRARDRATRCRSRCARRRHGPAQRPSRGWSRPRRPKARPPTTALPASRHPPARRRARRGLRHKGCRPGRPGTAPVRPRRARTRRRAGCARARIRRAARDGHGRRRRPSRSRTGMIRIAAS